MVHVQDSAETAYQYLVPGMPNARETKQCARRGFYYRSRTRLRTVGRTPPRVFTSGYEVSYHHTIIPYSHVRVTL